MTFREGTPPPLRLEPLGAAHSIAAFSSGDAAIDAFLHTQALPELELGLSSVLVAVDALDPRKVIGYFSLSPLSIRIDPRVLVALEVTKPAIPYPQVGGYLLGRMGVDVTAQGQGIGRALVAIALERARQGRVGTGGVFLAVDPKTEQLVQWYSRLGFHRISDGRRLVIRL